MYFLFKMLYNNELLLNPHQTIMTKFQFKLSLKILLMCCCLVGYLFISQSNLVHTFDGNVMTIDYHIMVEINDEKDHEKIQKIINKTFHETDQIYNNWNNYSEVSKINKMKANEVIGISPELEKLLEITESIVKLSNGRFDPTIEPLQQVWKNHLEIGTTPSNDEIDKIMPAVGWKNLHFGEGKLFKDHGITSLDLCGVAKGYCVDLLVERIVAAGYPNVFVEWGGEIRSHGRHANRPWKVFVGRLDDMNPQNAIAQIELHDQSIATSGDYIQNWNVKQKDSETTYYHIIDPQTARPLESSFTRVASATVIAPTCVIADALATVAMMYPTIEEARSWAEQISTKDPRIQFRLISRKEALEMDSY
jgi:thiamine biosynthesis lipoprotein